MLGSHAASSSNQAHEYLGSTVPRGQQKALCDDGLAGVTALGGDALLQQICQEANIITVLRT